MAHKGHALVNEAAVADLTLQALAGKEDITHAGTAQAGHAVRHILVQPVHERHVNTRRGGQRRLSAQVPVHHIFVPQLVGSAGIRRNDVGNADVVDPVEAGKTGQTGQTRTLRFMATKAIPPAPGAAGESAVR